MGIWAFSVNFSGGSGLRVEFSGKIGGVGNLVRIRAFVVEFSGNLVFFCEI